MFEVFVMLWKTLVFPITVDAFVRAGLGMRKEFGFDIKTQTSVSVLRVDVVICRNGDTEDFSIF